eukprot:SAG11_NODE_4565_length_1849_cov_1.276571_1_plen_120_part_00
MGLNPGRELPNAPYKNATGAVVQSWMPEHWYSNSYSIGSQTIRGGYGGRGFFDEEALAQKKAQTDQAQAEAQGQEGEVSTEFSFASGGYQGNIGTPEAGTSGEWYIENLLEELDGPNEW